MLGLTWAAVVAALILTLVWPFALLGARRESEEKPTMDKERLSRAER